MSPTLFPHPEPDTTLQAMLQEVRGYWEGLRQEGALPSRAVIDPRGMAGALSGAFLIERVGPGLARLRIAGMNFTNLLGMDARGMPLSALFDPVGRNRLSGLLEQVFQRPARAELLLRAETGLGRPELTGRMIVLPLAPDGERGALALGCLAIAGKIGRQPRRLAISHARAEPVFPPDLRAPAARLYDLADPPAFAVKPTPSAKPWLRLVDLEEARR
ncbi:MAG: PAS domain-containing protein [Gemmobacter sp.]|nr:PAS domain-containing protein [Gemmobacter sp.]